MSWRYDLCAHTYAQQFWTRREAWGAGEAVLTVPFCRHPQGDFVPLLWCNLPSLRRPAQTRAPPPRELLLSSMSTCWTSYSIATSRCFRDAPNFLFLLWSLPQVKGNAFTGAPVRDLEVILTRPSFSLSPPHIINHRVLWISPLKPFLHPSVPPSSLPPSHFKSLDSSAWTPTTAPRFASHTHSWSSPTHSPHSSWCEFISLPGLNFTNVPQSLG